MRSSAKLRLLLDTTYILPAVGVEVEGVEKTLETLWKLKRRRGVEVYYSHFSIMEALWKLAKLDYDPSIVETGLSLIREEFTPANPTPKGYVKALEIKRKGFRDLMDLLLYATALSHGILFLTRDVRLLTFLTEMKEDTSVVLFEEEFVKRYA